MYLKEIRANGFKSFADKINIVLENGTTCIVGPNGSGKSNIVDAVRWVLGEQSVKSLRGDGSMSDVIFQGSKTRAPLNTAYVELIFSNEDHTLSVPYTEVSIKRKVYRTGENEYFINQDRCRLKDIVDLLLDSGIGKSSFNIIGQGEVMQILSNQSEDRRIIFEEAAGILKYKKRKEEALKKLDKTHDAMERVEDIINELENQITPLKKQSEAALAYQETKDSLQKMDIALMIYDLDSYHEELKDISLSKEKLEKDIVLLSAEISQKESTITKEKLEQTKLEQEANLTQNALLKATEEVARIKGEINLMKASSLDLTDEKAIQDKTRLLFEEKESSIHQINLLKLELNKLNEDVKQQEEDLSNLKDELKTSEMKQQNYRQEKEALERDFIKNSYQIDSLKQELEHGGILPDAVQSVLSNKNLRGICDIIGNVVSIDEKYEKAFTSVSSSSHNFVIVLDEEAGKDAIDYLKNTRKGRATFFPISVIESRSIPKELKLKLEQNTNFIAVLSDLITCDKKYRNIIENQFGLVLVASDMDNAIALSNFVEHRFKIVTLDGNIIHAGGSMSGGSSFKSKNLYSMKTTLEQLLRKQEKLEKEKDALTKDFDLAFDKVQALLKKMTSLELSKEQALNLYLQKEKDLAKQEEVLRYQTITIQKYEGQLKGTLKEEEKALLESYSKQNSLKEELEFKQKTIQERINNILDKLQEIDASNKVLEQQVKEKEQQKQRLLLRENELSLRMDHLLENLNEEYGMTYDNAHQKYPLTMDVMEARSKLLDLKEALRKIGMVNLDAIDEYQRVKTRYDFLMQQKEDLSKAEGTLLEIMDEMDHVMQEEFLKTFDAIQSEFQKIFKELFKGGHADLILTDKKHLLTTGVDIVASPPGKKLSTISLLSGGEKTLTAISLLFAILNVRKLPFCLFDEVEAALDEANVDQFGNYLANYKNKTQFLIITHKKKTMEYADTLYGITMQESGVSKLVSVKLNEQEEYL